MSAITVFIRKVEKIEPSVLLKLKQGTGQSLSEVKNGLKPRSIFLQEELFLNNHGEISQKIKSVIEILNETEIDFSIHETGEGHMEENPDLDFWRIEEETLYSILEGF